MMPRLMEIKDLRVAISAPVDDNLYSLLVSQLCVNESGIKSVGVIILKVWSIKRIISESRRLGITIIRKIWEKYFLRNANKIYGEKKIIIESFINEVGLETTSHKKLCNKYKIPFLKVNNPNDKDAVEFLRKQRPDIILSIGSYILQKPFLEIPSIGVFNVHMGILPEYRGIGVTEWPIIEGRLKDVGLGITLHFMERGVDTGQIIIKKRIPLNISNNIYNLESKYLVEMVNLMVSGVKMARDGDLVSTPQRKQDGRQYFALHKRMKIIVEKKLESMQRCTSEYETEFGHI